MGMIGESRLERGIQNSKRNQSPFNLPNYFQNPEVRSAQYKKTDGSHHHYFELQTIFAIR